jgi:hypothetical protein
LLRTDWLGSKWLEGWEIGITLPCGRFPQVFKKENERIARRMKIRISGTK